MLGVSFIDLRGNSPVQLHRVKERPHAAPAAKHFAFLQVRFGLDLGEGGENSFFSFFVNVAESQAETISVADLLCSV